MFHLCILTYDITFDLYTNMMHKPRSNDGDLRTYKIYIDTHVVVHNQ